MNPEEEAKKLTAWYSPNAARRASSPAVRRQDNQQASARAAARATASRCCTRLGAPPRALRRSIPAPGGVRTVVAAGDSLWGGWIEAACVRFGGLGLSARPVHGGFLGWGVARRLAQGLIS
jgi:hypothetical protein